MKAAALAVVLLAGCATLEPPRPPEVRTTFVEVPTPVPVPCFTEEERPVLRPVTPVDIDNATASQLAAALAADEEAMEDFTRKVDALFIKCSKGGIK